MADVMDMLKAATCMFIDSGAANDIAVAEEVCTTGDVSEEQYEATILMRKVYSVLLLSAARAGLIPSVPENKIPRLYEDGKSDEIFPSRKDFSNWVIYDDRVIEAFVMPVLKKYQWNEILLLRQCEEADSLPVPQQVKDWIRDEVESIVESQFGELDESERADLPDCFIPEYSGLAAVVYENPSYSRLMYLCKGLEGKGYRLDSLLTDEMLGVYQKIAGYSFEISTLFWFSYERVWVDDKCYHCRITLDTIVYNDYGTEYLDGYSYYKYANPCLIFELPEYDAGMRKLLPIIEELSKKADKGELGSLKAVA